MSARVVSDWHLNDQGEWENRHGWICRQGHASEKSRGMVWIGWRPSQDDDGPAEGWGEVWAPDLETLMQRVDRLSGAYERIRATSPGLLPGMARQFRAEAWQQITLGGWIEAA